MATGAEILEQIGARNAVLPEVETINYDGGKPARSDAGEEGRLVFVPPGHSVYVYPTKGADE